MAEHLKKLNKWIVILLLVGIILLTAFLVYVFFGDFLAELFELLQHGDADEIAAYLNGQSQWGGYTALFLISILQVISIFIPGMVIQITGALIYGWWKAFLSCWLGFVAGNILVFCFARIFGRSIQFATSSESKNTWLMDKINHGNPPLVVAVACMVPGIPNGIIPYIAARSRITWKEFALAVFGSSWIQILLNCIIGHFLVRGQWGWMVAAIVLECFIIYLMIKYRDKLMGGKS